MIFSQGPVFKVGMSLSMIGSLNGAQQSCHLKMKWELKARVYKYIFCQIFFISYMLNKRPYMI